MKEILIKINDNFLLSLAGAAGGASIGFSFGDGGGYVGAISGFLYMMVTGFKKANKT